jgi:hypothetical protein
MWRHPKYYAELRKQARQQARKLTSLQDREDIIHEENERLYDRSNKSTSSQANEPRVRARKPKAQASSQSLQAPVSPSRGTSEPSPCQGHKQQG